MGLRTPEGLGDRGHGIRPFGCVVEFSPVPAGKAFADTRPGAWGQRLIQVNSVAIGYGADDLVAQLSSFDARAVGGDTVTNARQLLRVPRNGEGVRITVIDEKGRRRLVFKGTIRGLHERRNAGGVVWSCEAVGDGAKLNDSHFTGEFNKQDDAIQPSPHFDPVTGALVEHKLYTVKQIIDQILKYKDAWGTAEFFSPADIDWQGLDADKRCGLFTPSHVSFDNTPKGKAVEEVLQRAGNFTFLYDPTTDKLRVVELNAACDRLGPQWPIKFASVWADDIDADAVYAFDYHVEEDNTTWSTKSSANCCLLTSGPIQFFSGTWIIPERVVVPNKGDGTPDYDHHTKDEGPDTAARQKKRAVSPDGCYYRFHMPTEHGVHDTRDLQRYYVGMPLFPDWNIYEDWFPAVFEVNNVYVPSDWRAADYTDDNPTVTAGKPNPADYKAKGEFQPFCLGDQVARREVHLGHQDNLRAYQAWYAVDECPACKGWGMVKKVYDNADNEPDLKLVAKGPEGLKRMVIEVTNWIMKPSDFGATDAQGKRLAPPSGLLPFYDESGNPDTGTGTGGYPLPWKNTCPYCRGTGMKPEFKIRNIGQGLFANRNLKVDPGNQSNEIPADPAFEATGPETWEQAASRVSNFEGPLFQVEVPVAQRYVLPVYAKRNSNWADLDKLTDGSGNSTPLKRMMFPHPLQYKNVRRALLSVANVTVQPGDREGRDKVVPASWYCTVPFTTVMTGSPSQPSIDHKLGRVIFAEPLFIPCNKDYAAIQVVSKNRARLEAGGVLSTHAPARGFTTSDDRGLPTGYWRPARVWMTFCYEKDKYYNAASKDAAGAAIKATKVAVNGQNYLARAQVADGRWALEVVKAKSADDEVPADAGRLVQAAYAEQGAVIQVYEKDFWRRPVLSKPDATQAEIDAEKAAAGYEFAKGRVFKWQRPTPGELLVERAGYSDADHFSSLSRPTTYVWTLRDARPKLLGMAIRRLEMANEIQVEGSLTVVGPVGDTTAGLGFVDYPDKGRAAVKKVTYNFSNGMTAELELHREETRIGELPPTEREQMNVLVKSVARLARTADLADKAAKSGGGGASTPANAGPIDANTVRVFTQSAG